MTNTRIACLALAALVAAALAPRPAAADSVLLKDGRTLDCPKVEKQGDGSYKLKFGSGEIVLKGDVVREAFTTSASGAYEPKDDAERAKLEKGLVPHEGKWVTKAERDAQVAKRAAEAKKRIDEAKAHREWRNRYKEKTANFEFEYTIPPDIAKGYIDMMETYYAYFTRQFSCARPPKEKLKICFYHDYDTFLEVSGASYGVLAYYRFVAPRELNFYYDRLRPDETTAIMFHEAQHYLSHLFDLKFHIPHNFSESMAEYFGGSKWDRATKKMTTGGLQEGRLTEVQTDIAKGERKSLEKLVKNELGYEDYTWGWTFVHFMMETPKYSKKFQTFYRSLSSAKDIKRVSFQGDMTTIEGPELLRAFKKAMGVDDLAALEKEWNAYIDTKLKLESVVGFEEAAFAASASNRPLRANRFFKLAVENGSTNPCRFAPLSYFYVGWILKSDWIAELGTRDASAQFMQSFRGILESPDVSLLDKTWVYTDDFSRPHDVFRIKNGIERFFITDINNPSASSTSQSRIAVMADRIDMDPAGYNHIPGGSKVL